VAMNLKVRFLPCANVVVIKLIFFYFFIFAIATAAALFLSSPPHTHTTALLFMTCTLPLACRSIIETGVSHTGLAAARCCLYTRMHIFILT
jgi:hypothetical protein